MRRKPWTGKNLSAGPIFVFGIIESLYTFPELRADVWTVDPFDCFHPLLRVTFGYRVIMPTQIPEQ